MLAQHRNCLILFPGALGDFLCFLPTAEALREDLGTVTIVARAAYAPLLVDDRFDVIDIDRREVAGLFAEQPGPDTRELFGGFSRVVSWTGSEHQRFRKNLQALSTGSVEVFRFRDFRSGEHAVERFARCAGVEPRPVNLVLAEEARSWAAEIANQEQMDEGTLFLHGGSGSAAKCWKGMDELAAAWRRRGGNVVSLVGPADCAVQDSDAVIHSQPLDRIAAVLGLARHYVGNDSGISHLAAAMHCRGLALFGDSDPSIWRPRSDTIATVHAPVPCRDCGPGIFCTHRLSVADVLAQVDRHQSESYRRRT